jgi:hypothetical protein
MDYRLDPDTEKLGKDMQTAHRAYQQCLADLNADCTQDKIKAYNQSVKIYAMARQDATDNVRAVLAVLPADDAANFEREFMERYA